MTDTYSGDAKAALRRSVMERRRAAHGSGAVPAASAVSDHLLVAIVPQGKIIAGYWPLGDELDCRPALEALSAAGAQIVLPVVAGQGQVLIFRIWRPGDDLEQGPFGTMHPGARSPMAHPDVMLIPLIAFDRTGHRLGYGAGYYDRTLASYRAQKAIIALGLAYAVQEVDKVPIDHHDEPLDGVVTEVGTRWFGKSSQEGA